MSKQVNPTAIGAFVLGGVLLLAVGAALFGGTELFAKRTVYVAFFEEQTKGLRVGSNVVANGVRVGYVSDIALLVDEETYATMTRVTLDILPDAYVPVRNGRPIRGGMESGISHEELIDEAGLRAQLEIDSFITGQLLVRLENRPDTPIVLRGVDSPYLEIPTIPSDIQEILEGIQDWAANIRDTVDLGELSASLNDALRNVADLAASEDLAASIAGFSRLVNDRELGELITNLNSTLAEVREAAQEAGELMENADTEVATLADDLKPVLARLEDTLAQADSALAAANRQLSGDTDEAYQVQATFREIELAAKAMREFFDYMERNPEAFLRGKTEQN